MNNYDYIHYLLRNYHKLRKDLEYMKKELAITEERDSTITGMTLSSQIYGMKTQKNSISDPTANVALVFRKENERINRCFLDKEQTKEMQQNLENALDFLDTSVTRLRDLKEDWYTVIHQLMYKRMSWVEYTFKYNVSNGKLHNDLKSAIIQITKWWEGDYSWTDKIMGKKVKS